jgi:disulfide bond formation protein DsbB
MTQGLALRLNTLGLLAIVAVLAFTLGDQLLYKDLPCPLCILQRVGFVLAGFGLALNLRFSPHPSHYALTLFGALFCGAVSIRQILLHIVPGSGAYGDAFLELHFYTWALIVFVLIILGTACMLLFDRQFERSAHGTGPLTGLAFIVFALFVVLVLGNGLSTFLECGVGLCPDNPIEYEFLKGLQRR